MFTKVKNFIFLLFFLSFSSLTIKYYISENNIININKSRSSYVLSNSENLPILKNDTNNIIVYKDDIEEFKKSRKKRFWEKLILND